MKEYPNTQKTDTEVAQELLLPLLPQRQYFTYVMNAIAFGLTGLALIPLVSILIEILSKGIGGFKPEMLRNPVIENGFANAIVGTVVMVGIGALMSVPVGLMTGIFLAEFGKTNSIAQFIRFITSILSGVPSIVVGMFAYGVVVLSVRGFTAIAGGFALAVIMLPVIVLTTEEALKLIPVQQRLASAALGGTQFQTILRVVVGTAIPSITTGILLATARAAGETAPLLFTALFSLDWPANLLTGLFQPTASLPVLIYNLYNDPDPERNQLVWTTSIILLTLVLCFSILSRFVTSKNKVK